MYNRKGERGEKRAGLHPPARTEPLVFHISQAKYCEMFKEFPRLSDNTLELRHSEEVVMSTGSGSQIFWVQIPALPLVSYTTSAELVIIFCASISLPLKWEKIIMVSTL